MEGLGNDGIYGKKKHAMSVLVKCFILSKLFLASHANTVKGWGICGMENCSYSKIRDPKNENGANLLAG